MTMNSNLDYDVRLRDIFSEYEIIDAHVHPPARLPGSNFSPFDQTMTAEAFTGDLCRMGVRKCCGSVIHPICERTGFEAVHVLNVAALEFQKTCPDFYLPGIAVHPWYPEESCAEIETMVRNHGIRFIGELVPYMMGWGGVDLAAMDPVWDLIQQKNLAVNVHIGRAEDAAAVLKKFPHLKFIIAHPTADKQEYMNRIELIAQYENAALDISGSGPNTWGMLRYALDHAGTGKILFGSDFPIRNPGMYIAGVLFEHLSGFERESVFSRNFKNLVL